MKIPNFNSNNYYYYFVKVYLYIYPKYSQTWSMAHGMLNNEVPIIVFQIEKLKRNDHNFHKEKYQYLLDKFGMISMYKEKSNTTQVLSLFLSVQEKSH